MSHTPGPWIYAHDVGNSTYVTTVATCGDYVIGLPSDQPGGNYRDGDPSGDVEDDTRLIAAAPTLLAFADWAFNHATERAVVERARAAIAKATGQR